MLEEFVLALLLFIVGVAVLKKLGAMTGFMPALPALLAGIGVSILYHSTLYSTATFVIVAFLWVLAKKG